MVGPAVGEGVSLWPLVLKLRREEVRVHPDAVWDSAHDLKAIESKPVSPSF